MNSAALKNPEAYRQARALEKADYIQQRVPQIADNLRKLVLRANSDYKSFAVFKAMHPMRFMERELNRHDLSKLRFLIYPDEKLAEFARLLLEAQFDDTTAANLGENTAHFRRAWSKFLCSFPG